MSTTDPRITSLGQYYSILTIQSCPYLLFRASAYSPYPGRFVLASASNDLGCAIDITASSEPSFGANLRNRHCT